MKLDDRDWEDLLVLSERWGERGRTEVVRRLIREAMSREPVRDEAPTLLGVLEDRGGSGGAVAGSVDAPGPTAAASPRCEHRGARKLASGLVHCDDCGATRGIDRVWRG